jgi:hypothetical protein
MAQDKAMVEIKSSFGLDVDSTQKLLLITSEFFRLNHAFSARNSGLDDALAKRNNAQSKRKRYDRMKVCTCFWTYMHIPFNGPARCQAGVISWGMLPNTAVDTVDVRAVSNAAMAGASCEAAHAENATARDDAPSPGRTLHCRAGAEAEDIGRGMRSPMQESPDLNCSLPAIAWAPDAPRRMERCLRWHYNMPALSTKHLDESHVKFLHVCRSCSCTKTCSRARLVCQCRSLIMIHKQYHDYFVFNRPLLRCPSISCV